MQPFRSLEELTLSLHDMGSSWANWRQGIVSSPFFPHPSLPPTDTYWASMTTRHCVRHCGHSDPRLCSHWPLQLGSLSSATVLRCHPLSKPALTSTPSPLRQAGACPSRALIGSVWYLSLSTLDYSYLCTWFISLPDREASRAC